MALKVHLVSFRGRVFRSSFCSSLFTFRPITIMRKTQKKEPWGEGSLMKESVRRVCLQSFQLAYF